MQNQPNKGLSWQKRNTKRSKGEELIRERADGHWKAQGLFVSVPSISVILELPLKPALIKVCQSNAAPECVCTIENTKIRSCNSSTVTR